ncbi:hypothetical protein VN97_g12976, partial [Penicillium thymicola]
MEVPGSCQVTQPPCGCWVTTH